VNDADPPAAADLVLRGGRVIDPDSGLDGIRDVAITGDRITAVSEEPFNGTRILDVTGFVVAPGFIDMHSHSSSLEGFRLQALDGVTTVLELEGGASPVGEAYARAAAERRPINYGFSASWGLVRMAVVAGHPIDGRLTTFLAHIGDPGWQRAADGAEIASMVASLEGDLDTGALGIGVLVGYAPSVTPDEYLSVARLAASRGVPTYTHSRELVENAPDTVVDGAEEIVRAAGETGAHMHYCHVNSTSGRHVDRVLELVRRIRSEGSRVTTEAYPYGSGMTGIGATFLTPEGLRRIGLQPSSIRYVPTGERIANAARLEELREEDPGGLAIVDFLDEDDPADLSLLHRSLCFEDAVVASDAMPLTWMDGPPDPGAWPIPRRAVTHPRTAGTFSRALRVLTRERGFTLMEAIRRTSSLPARILEDAVPAMRTKGRLRPGCDADVVVFDPDSVTDRATYGESTLPSKGIRHVLVAGRFVVTDGELDLDASPGRAIRNGE
jgi:N-acyl-D-aspartate/D-glutamate deacylase